MGVGGPFSERRCSYRSHEVAERPSGPELTPNPQLRANGRSQTARPPLRAGPRHSQYAPGIDTVRKGPVDAVKLFAAESS